MKSTVNRLLGAMLFCCSMAGCAMAQDTSSTQLQTELQRATTLAEQSDGCALDDGYECLADSDQTFFTIDAQVSMLSGVLMQAWQIAWQDFSSREELPLEARNLKHYKTGVLQHADAYVVRFQGLLLPSVDEQQNVDGLMRASIGHSIEYRINRRTMQIDSVVWDK